MSNIGTAFADDVDEQGGIFGLQVFSSSMAFLVMASSFRSFLLAATVLENVIQHVKPRQQYVKSMLSSGCVLGFPLRS